MRVSAIAATILSVSTACFAQSASKVNDSSRHESVLQFSSHTGLVVLPVIVHHRNEHVSGLKRSDFTIYEDGKIKPVESFEEIKAADFVPALARRADLSQGQFSNVNSSSALPSQLTIITILLSGDVSDKAYAYHSVLKYLKQSQVIQPTALLSIGDDVRLIHDFSTDPQILAAALEGAQRGVAIANRGIAPPRTDASAASAGSPTASTISGSARAVMQQAQDTFSQAEDRFNRLDYAVQRCGTVEMVRTIARSLTSTPGRKAFIWIGSSGPLPVPSASYNPCFFQGQEALLELATANMSLYNIDPRGLIAHSGFGHPAETGLLQRNSTAHEDLNWSADASGGRAFFNSNDLAGVLGKAAQDSAEFYQLTYRLDHNLKPGWHKVKVEVNQPGVEVRTRSGFLTREPKPDADAEDLQRALGSPFMQTEIPLLVTWQPSIANSSGGKKIGFKVSVPGNALLVDDSDRNHVSISLTAVAMGLNGRVPFLNKEVEGHMSAGTMNTFAKTGINYSGEFELAPGRYEVKFAVRDNISGKVGR